MSTPATVAVVDSGYGNLRSVANALRAAGAEPVVTADPDVVRRAERIVVPGQGAFRDCVAGLAARDLDQAIREVVAAGRPFYGICLGLQVLFEESEEQGPCRGLGLLPGRVVRFAPSDPSVKVPHMGWNDLSVGRADPVLRGVATGDHVYFVHSYYVVPDDPQVVAATAEYAGVRFCAAVRRDNLFASQFHPEKSQRVGLRLLANFLGREAA